MNVLYDDNHVVVVFKPAGVLVQDDASGERTLQDEVKDWVAQKYAKPGAVYLGMVHRIDKPVSGIVVFARTSKGAARLSEQIRARAVQKTYRALVEGNVLQDRATLVHYLSEDDGYVSVHDKPGPERSERKEARLHYTVLRRDGQRTLLEIDLETGRKHQIRAQLARVGHPVVGDTRYGAKTTWPEGIALVSFRMRFKHPTQDREISVQVPLELDPLA